MGKESMQVKHSKARLAGFTLVETLVALVVMSVGMLGIAALYIEGLRSGQTSIARTTAVALAGDMADRIRSNPTVPNNPALPSSVPQSATPAAPVYAAGAPGANNGCVNGAVNCNPAQMAADDWFWWNQQIQNLLPVGSNATVAVTLPAPPIMTTRYTITVNWPEAAMAANAQYVLIFDR
jgi:type IV pilus assembly protein PilV